jgi:hypothetical protein
MIPTKICNSCNPPTEWPLNEKYFYKNKLSPDGFADKCKKCQKKNNLKRYYNKNRNLNNIYDINGKSKVKYQPEIKINKNVLAQWKKDLKTRLVVRCRNCGKLHVFNKNYDFYNCTCKRNLIYFNCVNFLWSKVIFIDEKMEDYSLLKFDPYK